MRPKGSLAVFLAVLVLGYTSFATFLECGMDGSPAQHAETAGRHHHEHGAPSGHTPHGGSTSPFADPGTPACCHGTLYNVVFQSVSALQLLRAEAHLAVPPGLAAVPALDTFVTPAAGYHWGTGPPHSGRNVALFPARPRYLAVSSFLV